MKFGISFEHFKILEDLIIKPLQSHGAQVWIFGSRATGKYVQFSDVDILYEVSSQLPSGFIFEIKSNIEESHFPYKVDLVERSKVADSYKKKIESEKILLSFE